MKKLLAPLEYLRAIFDVIQLARNVFRSDKPKKKRRGDGQLTNDELADTLADGKR